jgi:hypothetical protein
MDGNCTVTCDATCLTMAAEQAAQERDQLDAWVTEITGHTSYDSQTITQGITEQYWDDWWGGEEMQEFSYTTALDFTGALHERDSLQDQGLGCGDWGDGDIRTGGGCVTDNSFVHVAVFVASFVPVVDTAVDVVGLSVSVYHQDWDNAALYGGALAIPSVSGTQARAAREGIQHLDDTLRAAEPASHLVYRGGSRSADNLTPRPGIDSTGRSTFDTPGAAAPKGGKVQVIDTSKLKCTIACPDAPPPGHVSIRPLDPADIPGWAGTRGTGDISPYTQDIWDAIVDEIRLPRS